MATLLSSGYNNSVYTLETGEYNSPVEGQWVVKVFEDDDFFGPNLEKEYQALIQMGSINSLMVKVWDLTSHPSKKEELLIMERLVPVQPRAIDKETRLEFLKKFLDELKELHAQGWTHADIKRPSHCCDSDSDKWDNVIPTMEGIRLIDAGCAVNQENPYFPDEIQKDLADFCEFAKWFMKDVISEKDMIPFLREWLSI